MHRILARRVALVTIAIASIPWAIFLVWSIASREQIGGLSTPHLLAILALLLLPGATWIAWRMDRRAHAQAPPAAPPQSEHSAVTTTQRASIHAGPGREAAGAHRRDTRPDRSRTP